jgi:proteasome activator subunit 4
LNEATLAYLKPRIAHGSKQVRDYLAGTLKAVFSNAEETTFVKDLIKSLVTDAARVELIQTILLFFTFAVEDTTSFAPYLRDALPSTLALQVSSNEEVRNLSKMLLTLYSQLPLSPSEFEEIFATVIPKAIHDANDAWRIKGPLSPFIQILAFNHSFKITPTSLKRVYDALLELLFDEQREVNNTAKKALASVTKISPEATLELLDKFTRLLATSQKKKKGEAEGDDGLKARRRGALGLAALCEAHPYDVASWMPTALEQLALHLRDPKPIDAIAQESLKEFWRTHQDEWQFFSEHFTFEQQELIKQSSLPSYFA